MMSFLPSSIVIVENDTLLREEVSLKTPLLSVQNPNTMTSPVSLESVWTIRALYPMIGGYALLSSIGLLIFYLKDFRKPLTNSRTPDKDDSSEKDQSKMSAKRKAVLVSLMAAMFFIYIGMEEAFGTFISIFAVKSSLRFTRPEGYNQYPDYHTSFDPQAPQSRRYFGAVLQLHVG